MALSIQLPIQAIHYISTVNVFNGAFNTIVPGKYSFNTAANTDQTVLPMEINSMYLIERMFISGNIAAEDFLSALDTTNITYVQIKRKRDSVAQHTQKIPVIQFTPNRESPILVHSDKKDDYLTMSVTGLLNQNANIVGIDPVVIAVGLSIYQLNEKYITEGLRSAMSAQFGLAKKFSS